MSINGVGPFTFIFDSGANAVLSPDVVKRLRLGVQNAPAGVGTGALPLQAWKTNVSKVSLGPILLRKQTFNVTSLRDMPPVFGDIPIDGIIGRPIFSRAVVEVDYDRQEIVLTEPGSFVPQSTDEVISFTRIRDVPLINANLDGFEGLFGIDLGARSSLLLYSGFSRIYRLPDGASESSELITGWGLGGPIRSRLARANRFSVGSFIISKPLVRLSTQKTGIVSKSDIAGLVGADILRQFRITFDDAHNTIALRRSKRFGEITSFDKSGMWLVSDGKAFSVLEVAPDGAAARAGLRPGDRVLSINGVRSTSLLLTELREKWARVADGTEARLAVEREGKHLEYRLTFRSIV